VYDIISGETSLAGKYDIIRIDVQPTEQYKSVSNPKQLKIRSAKKIFQMRINFAFPCIGLSISQVSVAFPLDQLCAICSMNNG
jgi:hypothetical protein